MGMTKVTAYIRCNGGYKTVEAWLTEYDLGNGETREVALHKTDGGKYWLATDYATGLGLVGGKTRNGALRQINKAKYRRVCEGKIQLGRLENELSDWLKAQDTDSDDERNLRNRGRRE